MKRTLVFMASALALGACATDPITGESIYGNTGRGAAIGAIVGGLGGVFAGGNDGRNAAVGAAVGALAGAGIGRYMDGQEEDMRRKVATSGIGASSDTMPCARKACVAVTTAIRSPAARWRATASRAAGPISGAMRSATNAVLTASQCPSSGPTSSDR